MQRLFFILALLAGCLVSDSVAKDWLFVTLLEKKQIVTFERHPESGMLTRFGTTDCPAEPACMAASPDRHTLFVSFRSTGQLASFQIDQTNGALKLLGVASGGDDPAYLLPDRTGRFLISAYYQSNKVCVHSLSPAGEISPGSLQTIPTAEKAHGVVLDSRNAIAFVPHTGANRIYQFRFDAASGRLTANEPPFVATEASDHPRHIALHPSDRWAYVSNEAGDSLGVFEASKSGTLRRIQTVSSLPDGFDGARNSTARLEITPDGRFVYVGNRGHDSIAGFAIDQTTGRATSLGQTPTEQPPRSFSIESQGRYLYAAGQGSGRVAVFRINGDGSLTRFQTVDAGPVAWWALSVDGAK
jgi:6-phosphogluconolactonase